MLPQLCLFPTRCSASSHLAGPLPWEWCNGSWWQFDVQNNAGLCSEVPRCLRERILSFAGTSLIDSINNQDQGIGEGDVGVASVCAGPRIGCAHDQSWSAEPVGFFACHLPLHLPCPRHTHRVPLAHH